MTSQARRRAAGAVLGLVLVFPSFDLVARYTGSVGAVIYALAVIGVCLKTTPGVVLTNLRERLPVSYAIPITVIAFALTFAVVYPAVNSRGAESGSDRDDALNVGVEALLDGRNPYTARTYLDNPISPLPGSLLLAVPFVWLGNAAIQNVVWFAAWLVLLARVVDARFAATVAAVTLVGSPVVLQDLVTGGDLASNAIVVLTAVAFAAVARPGVPLIAAATLGGLAFATRLPFALLLPLAGAFIHRRIGTPAAVTYLAVLALVATAITLPFYVADPSGFTPWHTQNKFRFLAVGWPSAGIWLPAVSAALSLLAPMTVWRRAWPAWLVAGGVVLLVPVAIYSALAAALGASATATTGYALPAAFFAVPGLLAAIRHPPTRFRKNYREP